jgi:hypothetical protein
MQRQPNPSGHQILDRCQAHLAKHPAAPIRRPVNNDTLAPCFSFILGRTTASSFDGQVRYFSLAPVTHFDGLPSVHVLDRSVVSNLAWIGVFVALDEPQAVTGSLDCRDGAFNGVEDYIGYIWRLNKCKSCAAPV